MFRCSHKIIRERIYSCLLKLQLLKQSVIIHRCVLMMWLRKLVCSCWCVCVCVCVCVCCTARQQTELGKMWKLCEKIEFVYLDHTILITQNLCFIYIYTYIYIHIYIYIYIYIYITDVHSLTLTRESKHVELVIC